LELILCATKYYSNNRNVMTTEEKHLELKRYREILLATLDYSIERSKALDYGETLIVHYEQLKEKTDESFTKGRLTWLKSCLRDMTEAERETEDFGFVRYIKDKTGYNFDIFDKFHKRIDKILERKCIKTENQYREVLSMIDYLCQLTAVDQQKIDLLSSLLVGFGSKLSGIKTPKSKRESSVKNKHFFNQLLEIPSPDHQRTLILTESGTNADDGSTQVVIQFPQSGSGVYAVDGINLDIKTYWKDNQTIVIETKKEFHVKQKWEQVQDYTDIIVVEYMEKKY